jgi:tRNA pseudouridine38-40 synthase
MANIRLVLEYDGSTFHGWQIQPNARTIEGELERVLGIVLRQPIHPLYASSRTDAGVHARGHVVNFHFSVIPDLLRLKHSVSSMLRGQVSVLSAEVVPDEFHSRYNAICKQYTYTILNRQAPAVLDAGRAWYIPDRLDVEGMHRASQVFLGSHDFASFRGAMCTAQSAVKEIMVSEVTRDGDYVRYRVVGNAFVKHMVRNLVGTLVEIGRGFRDPDSMPVLLRAKDRRLAGPTAPPYGLCLDWVKYEH